MTSFSESICTKSNLITGVLGLYGRMSRFKHANSNRRRDVSRAQPANPQLLGQAENRPDTG